MHGSGGYILEEHPLLIVVAAILLLVAVWLVLKLTPLDQSGQRNTFRCCPRSSVE